MFAYILLQFNVWFGLMYSRKYDADWDRKLNRLICEDWKEATLDLYNYDVPSIKPDYHTMTFGKTTVWLRNKYFSYGHAYDLGRGRNKHQWWEKGRPKARTMLKLNRLVQHKLKEHKDKILKETVYE
jgi:hypothetical protein